MVDQIVDLIESVMPGPRGPVGPRGPLNPDTAPADEAVADWITGGGTKTSTALGVWLDRLRPQDRGYVDIRIMGCRTDEGYDNAPLINGWLDEHPGDGVYVPEGMWPISSTVRTGVSSIICDGAFAANAGGVFDDKVMVACGQPRGATSDTLISGRTIRVNCEGMIQDVVGVSLQGFAYCDIQVTANKCMAGGVKTKKRNVANRLAVNFAGNGDSDWCDYGMWMADGDNDNIIVSLVGENAQVAFHGNVAKTRIQYFHPWGCGIGVDADSGDAQIEIDYYYPDYVDYAFAGMTGTPARVPAYHVIRLDTISQKDNQILHNTRQSMRLEVEHCTIGLVTDGSNIYWTRCLCREYNMSEYRLKEYIRIHCDDAAVIDPMDLNSMDMGQLNAKYGTIAMSKMIPGLTVVFPPLADPPANIMDSHMAARLEDAGWPVRLLANETYTFVRNYVVAQTVNMTPGWWTDGRNSWRTELAMGFVPAYTIDAQGNVSRIERTPITKDTT